MLRTILPVLVASLVVAPSSVQGYAKYVQLLPNGGNVPDAPNLGHLDPAGQSGLSDFGKAFSKASNAWTSALCKEDTDGDGYTNGQELGDPCCTWTESNPAGLVADGISNPTDASKIPTNSKLLAGCTGGGTNSTGSGNMTDVVGTVAPAGPMKGGVPLDDDEDDSSESAVQTAGAVSFSFSCLIMVLASAVAVAIVV